MNKKVLVLMSVTCLLTGVAFVGIAGKNLLDFSFNISYLFLIHFGGLKSFYTLCFFQTFCCDFLTFSVLVMFCRSFQKVSLF